jgi:hypothetical protein
MLGSLQSLLITMATVIPVLSAIFLGLKMGGADGTLIGALVGLGIGLGNYFCLSILGKKLRGWGHDRLEQGHSIIWPRRLWGLMNVMILLWLIVSAIIGVSITHFVILYYGI